MPDQENPDLRQDTDDSVPDSCLFAADGLCHNSIMPHTGTSCPYNRAYMPHCRRYKPEARPPAQPGADTALDGLPSIKKLASGKSDPPSEKP
jgi:hypothetical protein